MRYKVKPEKKPNLSSFGKYRAVAVHGSTIGSRQIAKEAAQGTVLTPIDIEGIMMRISDVVSRHLRNGDKVRLRDIGMLKLEIESEKVDDPKDFHPRKHIRGVRLHLIPASENGSPQLYQGVTFSKAKDYEE